MDTFKLKVFAISVMLIDHIGIVLISGMNNYWLYLASRSIGRLAFPIFAFLIVEGFRHTKDVKKYLMRLLAFAAISEIPYDFAFYQYHNNTSAIADIQYIFTDFSHISIVLRRLIDSQNVFFTLFLGLLLITLFDMIDKRYFKNDLESLLIRNSLEGILLVGICYIAFILRTDYDFAGILIIASFYLFRDSIAFMGIALFVISGTLLCQISVFLNTGNLGAIISILATLAIIPIAFYNGKKGKNAKYLFYAFYPVHLVCLFLIRLAL